MRTYVLTIMCAILIGFTGALLLSAPKAKARPVKCTEYYMAGFTLRVVPPGACIATRRWT